MKKLIIFFKKFFNKKIRDKKLSEYDFEINNDRNDGWTKIHYKELYDKRVKLLKKSE